MIKLILLVVGVITSTISISAEKYLPHHGDIIFQSLPHSDLVNAIEGATESKYSHVGIVIKSENGWIVREAIGDVHDTPLNEFISRGREEKIDVYRLKSKYQKFIPNFISASQTYLNHPYDIRYRMDDEKIYCSELVYKAFKNASGIKLGKLVKLGKLKWGKYESLIKNIEGGKVPKKRIMITPVDLSQAKQLKMVYSSDSL